jgi:UDP-glucose 4-epimerase
VGAHSSGLIGENPLGTPNNLMPYISKVASGALNSLPIFGNDYETADGTGVRDYLHVIDLAEGHLAALLYLQKNKVCEVFNLGTGKGTSVLELIQAFEKTNQKKINYEITARRPGDVASCFADVKKANNRLNWKTIFEIKDMCSDAWGWESKIT